MNRALTHYISAVIAALLTLPATAYAGGFMLGDGSAGEPGDVWAKLSYTSWRADEVFAGIFDRNQRAGIEIGDPIPFDSSTGGSFSSQAFAANITVTPLERVSLAGYFPIYQVARFEDSTFVSTSTGTGDIWLASGYQLTPDDIDVASTAGLQLKIPTTSLPREFENVPLSQGQYDVAVEHITTWTILPSLQVSLKTLLRRRFAFRDDDRIIEPGDEAELGLSVGGAPLSWLWLSAGYNGLWSTGDQDKSGSGAVSLISRRRVHELSVGTYLQFGKWLGPPLDGVALDAWAAYPITGQDHPRGLSWSIGLAWARR